MVFYEITKDVSSMAQPRRIPFYEYEYSDSKGTFIGWSRKVELLVKLNNKLQLIVAIALSAPLYYRLQHIEKLNLQPLCTKWHLVSKYKEGADSATWLALSMFGNPEDLMENIYKSGRGPKCGYPRVFQKAKKSTDLYTFDHLDVATDENSVCIFSSQKGIAAKLNALHRDKGELIVLDVNGPFCTPSLGKYLKTALSSSYGKTVQLFIRKIAESKIPNDELKAEYERSRNIVEKTLYNACFRHYKSIDSLINSFTLVHLAASIANSIDVTDKGSSTQHYGIGISPEDLLDELVDVAKSSLVEEVDIEAATAYLISKLKAWEPVYDEKIFGFIRPYKGDTKKKKYEVFTLSTPFHVIMDEVCNKFELSKRYFQQYLASVGYLYKIEEKVDNGSRDRFQKRRNGKKGYTMLIPVDEWNNAP